VSKVNYMVMWMFSGIFGLPPKISMTFHMKVTIETPIGIFFFWKTLHDMTFGVASA
jgi:hypothetical protein